MKANQGSLTRAHTIADAVRGDLRDYLEYMYAKEWKTLPRSFKTSLLNHVFNQVKFNLEAQRGRIWQEAAEILKYSSASRKILVGNFSQRAISKQIGRYISEGKP